MGHESACGAVFVYGTLKPGERNEHVARSAGAFSARPAYVTGYDLYDLSPEGYPAVMPGQGRVDGFVLEYPDLAAALPVLDRLEGCDETPPLYRRVRALALPTDEEVWVYVYNRLERLERPGAVRLPGGAWPRDRTWP